MDKEQRQKRHEEDLAAYEEAKAKGEQYRLFTATFDYFATGEGRTLGFAATGAYNEDDARRRFMREDFFGEWYGRGMEVYEGLPHNDDSAAQFLLSLSQIAFLKEHIKKLDCHLVVNERFHFNYS